MDERQHRRIIMKLEEVSEQCLLERDFAMVLANKVLDRPSGDPDDDLAVLARQFLRTRERLQAIQEIVNKQAKNEGLWFEAATALEGYLQQELRRLHRVCGSPTSSRTHMPCFGLIGLSDAQR